MVRKYGLHILGYMLKNGWDEGYLKKEGQLQKVVEMLKNYPNEKLFLGA